MENHNLTRLNHLEVNPMPADNHKWWSYRIKYALNVGYFHCQLLPIFMLSQKASDLCFVTVFFQWMNWTCMMFDELHYSGTFAGSFWHGYGKEIPWLTFCWHLGFPSHFPVFLIALAFLPVLFSVTSSLHVILLHLYWARWIWSNDKRVFVFHSPLQPIWYKEVKKSFIGFFFFLSMASSYIGPYVFSRPLSLEHLCMWGYLIDGSFWVLTTMSEVSIFF